MAKSNKLAEVERVIISTPMADTEFDLDDPVWVWISGKNYVVKKASEVVEGEKVLSDRSINRPLGEIEKYLLGFDLYRGAKEQIFERVGGTYVTKLRTLLTRGSHRLAQLVSQMDGNSLGAVSLYSAARGAILSLVPKKFRPRLKSLFVGAQSYLGPNADLVLMSDFLATASTVSSKGVSEMGELSSNDLEEMLASDSLPDNARSFVHSLVKHCLDEASGGNKSKTRSIGQVRCWCSGSTSDESVYDPTYAPSDWSLFRVLARIEPSFEQFATDYKNREKVGGIEAVESNRWHSYRYYVGARQRIVGAMSRPGTYRKHERSHQQGDARSLFPLIRILEETIVTPVDDKFSSPVVTSIRRVSRSKSAPRQTPEGIITSRETPTERINLVRINYHSDYAILFSAVVGMLHSYFTSQGYEKLPYECYRQIGMCMSSIVERSFRNLDNGIENIEYFPDGVERDQYKRLVKEAAIALQTGKMDEVVAPGGEGYCVSICRVLKSIQDAEPREYKEIIAINLRDSYFDLGHATANPGERRENKKRYTRAKQRLLTRHGYDYDQDLPHMERTFEFMARTNTIAGMFLASPDQETSNLIPYTIDHDLVGFYSESKIIQTLAKFDQLHLRQFVDIRTYMPK